MFIPGFGIAWGAFAAFSTGMAFSVLQNANPMLENIPSLTILFMSPFGLMEVAAYSIAMSRSYMIVHKIIKRIPIRPDFRVIGLEIAILVGLLLAGGFVEYYFIESIIHRYAKNLEVILSVLWYGDIDHGDPFRLTHPQVFFQFHGNTGARSASSFQINHDFLTFF